MAHTNRFAIDLVFAIALTACATSTALAEIIAHDGFEGGDSGGTVLGSGGGVGFDGNWEAGGFNAAVHDSFLIANESLKYANLATAGKRMETVAQQDRMAGITRKLKTPLGARDETVYMSFLIRPEGTLNDGLYNGYFGVLLEQDNDAELFVGKAGQGATDRWVLENRGGRNQVVSDAVLNVGEVSLIVVKIEFTAAGSDQCTLYVNPKPGTSEPKAGSVKQDLDNETVNGLTVYATGAFSLDEIRLGRSFEVVTPTAE